MATDQHICCFRRQVPGAPFETQLHPKGGGSIRHNSILATTARSGLSCAKKLMIAMALLAQVTFCGNLRLTEFSTSSWGMGVPGLLHRSYQGTAHIHTHTTHRHDHRVVQVSPWPGPKRPSEVPSPPKTPTSVRTEAGARATTPPEHSCPARRIRHLRPPSLRPTHCAPAARCHRPRSAEAGTLPPQCRPSGTPAAPRSRSGLCRLLAAFSPWRGSTSDELLTARPGLGLFAAPPQLPTAGVPPQSRDCSPPLPGYPPPGLAPASRRRGRQR